MKSRKRLECDEAEGKADPRLHASMPKADLDSFLADCGATVAVNPPLG